MDKISKRRLAENQVVFRKANEQLKQLIDELSEIPVERGAEPNHFDADELYQFFCECSDEKCRERMELSYDEYEKIHARHDTFAILANHEVPEIEEITDKLRGYVIVRKNEVPSKSVEKLHKTQLNNA